MERGESNKWRENSNKEEEKMVTRGRERLNLEEEFVTS